MKFDNYTLILFDWISYFAHIYNVQQHSFVVQLWQGETASWFKSIQDGTLFYKLFTIICPLKIQVALLTRLSLFKLHH